MRAVVLGAGGTVGRRVSAELARDQEVEHLLVAGRDEEAVERISRILGGTPGRVDPLVVDANDRATLTAAVRDANVVVSCAGPAYEVEVEPARACIDAGVPYVSLCDDYDALESLRSFDKDARSAGATIVSGCGLSPGMTNLLVGLARDELDDVTEVDIALAVSSSEAPGRAAALHLLHSLTTPAPYVSEGSVSIDRAGTGPKLVYFPDPVGWVETFHSGHPEVVTVPELLGGPRSLRFRLGLTERAVMDVARAMAASRLAVPRGTRGALVTLSAPLRPLLERLPPGSRSWSAARVDVHGRSGNHATTVSLGVVDHLPNLASQTIALAASLLGSGEVVAPGVHAPEQVFEPKSFLSRLGRRGIRAARLEPHMS